MKKVEIEQDRESNEDGSCKHIHVITPRPVAGKLEWFTNCAWCHAEHKPGEKLNPAIITVVDE